MTYDQMWQEATRVWENESRSIAALRERVDRHSFCVALEMVADCVASGRKIVSFGLGTSACAAEKIAHSFNVVNVPAVVLDGGKAAHGGLGVIERDDVVIAISKGGSSEELVRILPSIKEKGAKLIGVTEKPESALGKLADVIVSATVEQEACPLGMLATSSTLAVIAAFDAMAIAMEQYPQFSKEAFLCNHPNGAVGHLLMEQLGK